MSNAYMDKRRAEIDAHMQIAERVTRQFDIDTWQIALARYGKLDLGYQRIMEITELAIKVREEYSGAIIKACTGTTWTRSCRKLPKATWQSSRLRSDTRN